MIQFFIGVSLGVVVTFCLGMKVVYYALQGKMVETDKNRQIEILKNALLTSALLVMNERDFDKSLNLAYNTYDGTVLPGLSGSSIENACLSYIWNQEEFQNDPWYSPQMEAKLDAVYLYLHKHFATNDNVKTFFTEFLSKCIFPVLEKSGDDTDLAETNKEKIA